MSTLERKPSYASVVAGTHLDDHTAPENPLEEVLTQTNTATHAVEHLPASEGTTDDECGRHLDPEDPAYRGKNPKNRVDAATATYTSIIQTRAAKAANGSVPSVQSTSPPKRSRKRGTRRRQVNQDDAYSSEDGEISRPKTKKTKADNAVVELAGVETTIDTLLQDQVEQEIAQHHVREPPKRTRPAPQPGHSSQDLYRENVFSDEETPARKRPKTSNVDNPTAMSSRALGKQPENSSLHRAGGSTSKRRTDPSKLQSWRIKNPSPPAEEAGSEEDAISQDGDVNLDEYDLDDDFIDDSEMALPEAETGQSLGSQHRSSRTVQRMEEDGREGNLQQPVHLSHIMQPRTSTLKRAGAMMSIDQPNVPLMTPPQTPLDYNRPSRLDRPSPSPSQRRVAQSPFRPSPSMGQPPSSTPRASFAANVSAFSRSSHGSPLQSAFSTPVTPTSQILRSVPPTSTPTPPTPTSTTSAASRPTAGRTRRAFGSVVTGGTPNAPPPQSLSPARALDDGIYHRVTELPATCQVTDPSLQDPMLAQFYSGLPPLKHGMFHPWTDNPGQGMVQFSKWADQCPSMSFDSCISAIEFRSFDVFLNPSRVSPLDYCVREYPGSRPRFHLYTSDHRPAVCVSTILCKESNIIQPVTRGLRHKGVLGVQHSQEWERSVGFQCTLFGHPLMWAQLGMDSMQYATKTDFSQRDATSNSPGSRSMYSNVRSPSVVSRSRSGAIGSNDTFSLDCDAEIPVYDCRAIEVDFSTDLANLTSFPRWSGEIPQDSFVVVGYTVGVYKTASGNWSISYNIQWAIILGIPEDN